MHDPILQHIADLVEPPDPRDALRALDRQITDIQRMVEKAAALFSPAAPDPETHGIFGKLAERLFFKTYALTTLRSILAQPGLPGDIATNAKALCAKTEAVDKLLLELVQIYYNKLTDIPAVKASLTREKITLPDFHAKLLAASQELNHLLQLYTTAATLDPMPITRAGLEKERANIRKNRAELLIAALHIPRPDHATGDSANDTLHISAQEAINAIATTLDLLELACRNIEARLDAVDHPRNSIASVH